MSANASAPSFFVRNACGFSISLVDLFYLRKWNLLCMCMSGISPRIPLFSCQQKIRRERSGHLVLLDKKFRRERRVKCHLWDIESVKIVLSNLKLTNTNVCFIL